MTLESETTKAIKLAIAQLPPQDHERCVLLAKHIRTCVEIAGDVVGPMAVALIGSEMQDRSYE